MAGKPVASVKRAIWLRTAKSNGRITRSTRGSAARKSRQLATIATPRDGPSAPGQAGLWAGERRRTSAANWKQPYKWNNAAPMSGRRQRVFCASLADVFDNQVPQEWRADLFAMIRETPNLDWLLLTKRPQNIRKMLPKIGAKAIRTCGLERLSRTEPRRTGAFRSCCNARQRFASYRASRCLSTSISAICNGRTNRRPAHWRSAILGCRWATDLVERVRRLDWVICGGESGPGARTDPKWAESFARPMRCGRRCAFFMKQMSGVRKPLPPIPAPSDAAPVSRVKSIPTRSAET
jgi:protein gp37